MPKLFSGFELITVTDNYEDISSFREFKIYVNAASATITLPIDLPVGSLRIIKKIHPTQGTVTIESAGAEKFTRAELDDVTLNADGDFWLLEKVKSDRWDLVDGFETGSNANGEYVKYANGTLIMYRNYTQEWPVGFTLVEVPAPSVVVSGAWSAMWGVSVAGWVKIGCQSINTSNWHVSVVMEVENTRTIRLTFLGRWK